MMVVLSLKLLIRKSHALVSNGTLDSNRAKYFNTHGMFKVIPESNISIVRLKWYSDCPPLKNLQELTCCYFLRHASVRGNSEHITSCRVNLQPETKTWRRLNPRHKYYVQQMNTNGFAFNSNSYNGTPGNEQQDEIATISFVFFSHCNGPRDSLFS